MPITSRYVLLCDEVRREDNGKFIILGLYAPNPMVHQIPVTLPSLTFFHALQSTQSGDFKLQAVLQHTESRHQIGQLEGLLQIAQPGLGFLSLRFMNLQIDRVGAFDLTMSVEGQAEALSTSFEILVKPA